jgi:putative ABC transport system permease protein
MLHDLRLAFRSLRSWRFGAVVAVLTLAIGIGTATSMFALVRIALGSIIPDIEDLPSLGRIYASSRAMGIERSPLALKDVGLLSTASSFESVGAYTSEESDVTIAGQPLTISLGEVSAGFFPAMYARAASGRVFSPDDFHEGAQVAVVSDRIWRTQFAGRALVNAVITIDGTPRTVVGVLPAGFGFTFIGIGADVWIPIRTGPDASGRKVAVLARLAPGAAWTAAAAELGALARPQNPNGLWTWSAITVEQDVSTRTTGGFAMLFGPALIVLLIGCTNVACMLLARGIDRDVELSVRSALGATRARVMRQLVAESVVLGALGGALGSALTYALLRLVDSEMAQFRPDAPSFIPPMSTLLPLCLAFSAGACVLFGTLPAIRLSRRDIVSSLTGASRQASGRFVGYGARDVVVFVEVGAAVALVVTTALFVRFFVELQRITPTFPADRVIAVSLPPGDAIASAEGVSAVPGVAAVSLASDLPGSRRPSRTARITSEDGRGSRAALLGIAPTFLQTLGIPVIRGRTFDRTEIRPDVAIISDAAAAVLWPGKDPVGATMTISAKNGTSRVKVIGIARGALDAGALMRAGLIPPDIYLPLDRTDAAELLLVARTSTDAHPVVRAVAAAIVSAPNARRPRPAVLADEATFAAPDSLFVIRLFAGFGLIALLLAATGIFGVISQSVAQRTREFGVRMAVGASAGQVLRLVLAREARLILAAVATGVIGTVLVTRSAFVEMLVISGSDPRTWLVVAGLCGGTAAIAVAFATWRIVRLDPWKVLRDA